MRGALALALLAAFGNSLYAYAQKQATPMANPFAFGAAALLAAGMAMSLIAWMAPAQVTLVELRSNLPFVALAACGYVLLFLGLYFLYQRYGPGHYTLYAVLAIMLTSLAMPWLALGQKPGPGQLAASGLALLAIVLLLKESR